MNPTTRTRRLPRAVQSYRDERPEKKFFIRTSWITIMAGAIPEVGAEPKRTNAATQKRMGAMLGQDRSTMNRNLRIFTGEPEDEDQSKTNGRDVTRSTSGAFSMGTNSKVDISGADDPAEKEVQNSSQADHSQEQHEADQLLKADSSASPLNDKAKRNKSTPGRIAAFFNKWRPAIGCCCRYSERRSEQSKPGLEERDLEPALDVCPQCKAVPKRVKGERFLRFCTRCAKQYSVEAQIRTRDARQLALVYGLDYFDPAPKDHRSSENEPLLTRNVNGYFECDEWIFDPNMPRPVRCGCRIGQMKFNFSSNCLKCGGKGFTIHPSRKMGANARIFLAGLIAAMIKDKPIKKSQEWLGKRFGMSVGLIADCEDQWEDLKILQIIPGKVWYQCHLCGGRSENSECATCHINGEVCDREDHTLIWLPGLLMDHAIIEHERSRFAQACDIARLNGFSGELLRRIISTHTENLQRWFLSRHSIHAFLNGMRKILRHNGIERDLTKTLFPIRAG